MMGWIERQRERHRERKREKERDVINRIEQKKYIHIANKQSISIQIKSIQYHYKLNQ